MAEATESIVIQRPAADVFDFVTSPEKTPLWVSALSEVRRLSPGPITEGARVEEIASILGKSIRNTKVVTRYDPPTRFAAETVEGPVPNSMDFTFEETEGGTRVTLRAGASAGGVFGMMEGLLIRAARSQLRGDLERLKRILERGAS